MGVSNIINQNKANNDASILASIQELKNSVEYLGSELFALQELVKQRYSTKSTNKQQENHSVVIDSNVEEWVASDEFDGIKFPRLPITSIDVLNLFDEELSEDKDDYVQKATDYVLSKLNQVKNTKKQFTRRTQLKSMLFADSLLKTCTWKIAAQGKPNRFYRLNAILSLFVNVVNTNVDEKIDMNGTHKYFRDLLKRKEDAAPKVSAKKLKINENPDAEADKDSLDPVIILKDQSGSKDPSIEQGKPENTTETEFSSEFNATTESVISPKETSDMIIEEEQRKEK